MKKRPNKKENIHHNCFEAIRDLCSDDPDWYKLFDDASNGIFRDGFKYINGKIIYQQRGKSAANAPNVEVPADPARALEVCKDFIKKRGFVTGKEKEELTQKKLKRDEKGWRTIRRSDDKEYFLHRFIDRAMDKCKMSPEELIELKHIVFSGILTERIAPDDIVFQEGVIRDIKFSEYEKFIRKIEARVSISPE